MVGVGWDGEGFWESASGVGKGSGGRMHGGVEAHGRTGEDSGGGDSRERELRRIVERQRKER